MRCIGVEPLLFLLICVFEIIHPQTTDDESSINYLLRNFGSIAHGATNLQISDDDGATNIATRQLPGDTSSYKSNSDVEKTYSQEGETRMRGILENFRKHMREGIAELRIPILEPLKISEIGVVVDKPRIANITLRIQKAGISGVSTFVVNKASASINNLTFTVDLTIPKLYATGFYNISGVVNRKNRIRAAGFYRMIMYNFRFYLNLELGYLKKGMYVKKLNLDFSLQSARARLRNSVNHALDRIMSKGVEELLPGTLKTVKPDILPFVRDYLTTHFNGALKKLPLGDLLYIVDM